MVVFCDYSLESTMSVVGDAVKIHMISPTPPLVNRTPSVSYPHAHVVLGRDCAKASLLDKFVRSSSSCIGSIAHGQLTLEALTWTKSLQGMISLIELNDQLPCSLAFKNP